jgi:hypothetical protein
MLNANPVAELAERCPESCQVVKTSVGGKTFVALQTKKTGKIMKCWQKVQGGYRDSRMVPTVGWTYWFS